MKIAFIGQKGIPAKFGGVETHAQELAVRLAGFGNEVVVYVRNNYTDKNIQKYKGVKLVHLPSIATKNLDAITHTFLAIVHALFCRYDVVHFHAIGPSSLAWIVKIFSPKTILVATFHCQDYLHQKWSFFARSYLRFGEKMANIIPDRTIVVSKLLGEYAEKKYHNNPMFIPNGATIGNNKESLKLSAWNIRKKKYILSMGRLVKHKGVHYLIEAFKQLEDTNRLPNNFKLVIVGAGSFTDDYVKYLKTISQERDSIIFTGNQTGGALSQLLSNAYLFVQPSESEGLSIALLEAMGHSVAPLVSDIPENIEAIGEDGFSFSNKNVDSLRDKLAYLLNKPDEVENMGKKSQQRIAKEFSWQSIAQKTDRLYRDIAMKKEK
ncbi:MAG: Glycosyl transferase group 1 [Candidatus Moranbacteria bacterium GW2011_GWE2_35_2-]|nr:MAG: Glycosyl transferase group 1 [Candidatus Moranbacteria bacterium GW2011_GWE2_35_2-]KKQ04629.1 MAG: Glycosyl transferase group 1 [Candidatus Moranbacteria bacterium GW2011_GWF1_36_4]KKQ21984.1 MAG: Glycosyl transferase group 1 [Candidatus Moranbacteria bacterium GW2011_GWF2_37_11]KKQ29105.1 MAG: Glycosyl transferase group 1 [Candidatus Moranbacteria bacterium GW2011_GWD1_37_17]KKQ31090.1 MAG: Glycosyl transferase group 1 [Candidatus Moranbacteria bacterium GW2011_GWE1_37_24]KKQ46887.1 M